MTVKFKLKLSVALSIAFLVGEYVGTARAKHKRKNIINYYEKEMKRESLSGEIISWANTHMHGMTPEEFQKELWQKLSYLRISLNG